MKNMSLHPSLGGAFGVAALCAIGSAQAATATVDATIALNWSTLDEIAEWSWSHAFNGADAEADGATVSDYTSPDDDPAEARIGDVAIGSAFTSDMAPYARGAVSVDGITALSASASGTSHRGRAFEAKRSATVLFSFDYLMAEDFVLERADDQVGSYAIAELVLRENGTDVAYVNAERAWANGALLPHAQDPLSGALFFEYEVTEGFGYYLEGHVYSSASASTSPVPLPASLPLLGAALAGFGPARRRRAGRAVPAPTTGGSRRMKRRLLQTLLGAAVLLGGGQAAADILTVTYTGSIVDCPNGCGNVSKDYVNVFGLGAGASLVGQDYEAVFMFDTSLGNYLDAGNLSQVYGGTQYGVPTPLVSATLFVNGQGASIPGDTLGSAFNLVNPPGSNSQLSHQAQSLCMDEGCADPVYKVFSSYVANTTGGGWPGSVLTPFSYTVGPDDELNPSFNFFEIFEDNQMVAVAWLSPARVTASVAPVPLPAALPLLVSALAGLGLAARRRA